MCLGSLFCGATGWAQRLSHADVEQALDMRLRAAFEEVGTGLQIVTVAHRSELKLPEGRVSWELGTDVAGLEPGYHTLPVTILVNGRHVARTKVSVTLKQRVQTPMLQRSLKRGEMVYREDVRMHDVVLTRPLRGRIRAIQDVVGMMANRSLRSGKVLVDRWFDLPLAVDRGDRVRIQLVRGALKIETTGVALQRGRVGDQIPVRNPQSRTQYEARITAPGEARVQAW